MIGRLIILLLSLSIMAHADGLASHKQTAKGITLFKQAYKSWNNAGFWNAAEAFERATRISPELELNYYWLGTAHFHRMLLLQHKEGEKHQAAAKTEMKDAIEALERAIELNPQHAEAHALLGTLYGMKIDGSMLRAIRLGPSVKKHHDLALEHGKKNPRVHYLLGASLLHTAEDEADRIEALKSLLLAETLYDSELAQAKKKGAAWNHPRWGYDACLSFIGQTFEEIHKPDKAADYYQKALLARPTSEKAKEGLKRLSKSN